MNSQKERKIKIQYYEYNSFLIESENKKIAIDPGALFFYYFRFTTVIPKTEWDTITHIIVTHGDPDHHWYTDKVALASNAPVICNKTMVKQVNGESLMLGPRDKGLAFTTRIKNLHTLSVNESIELDEISFTGIKTVHGPLTLKLGPLKKTVEPGPEERIGRGAMGFKIQLADKIIVNLGDTIYLENEWSDIKNPDVLMIPIGGEEVLNTMDASEALRAIQDMQPKLVIPCHYNCPAFFSKKFNPADEMDFKNRVEQIGIKCEILKNGEHIEM